MFRQSMGRFDYFRTRANKYKSLSQRGGVNNKYFGEK